ncbi:MAG: nucleotidyl transferase AbiEii/AbiGii toxin family protein [Candidatus Moraniibacteriota bacterium]
MNNDLLENLVKSLGISRDQVLREEAELSVLDAIANHSLGERVIFYGGTALRLAYGSPRFSEDIDLIRMKSFPFSEFDRFAREVAGKHEGWTLSDIKEKRNTFFALFLIRHPQLKHSFSLKIELHIPSKKISLSNQLMLIKSPASVLEPLLLVPTLDELKDLKEKALMGRKKARDLFDLWYIAQVSRAPLTLPGVLPEFSEREFKNELKVFLPRKYFPIIDQLYEQSQRKN